MKKYVILSLLTLVVCSLLAQEIVSPTKGTVIDLGLSVKWTSCNLGANSPEEYGDYIAWAEIFPQKTYQKDLSFVYTVDIDLLRDRGIVDEKNNLTPTYDAATVRLGVNYRIPTRDEFDELMSPINCKWTWTTYKGVPGYYVKSLKNGNSIFFPAAGNRNEDKLNHMGVRSRYWTSTALKNKVGAYIMYFFLDNLYVKYYDYRYIGNSVRAICK